MKGLAKLISFLLTICLVSGFTTVVPAQAANSSSTNNLKNLASTTDTGIKLSSYTMTVGDSMDFTVKLAKYYSVKGKDVVHITKSGKTLTIEAIAEGEATITFKNSKKKVIEKISITVESDELIEDTDDSDTAQDQYVQPTPAPSQQVEGSNRPIYNGVVYLTIGTKTPITQIYSVSENGVTGTTIDVSMADGYIAAVNNGDTVSASISNGTLYITLKKSGDPYVIVADAQGKSIYRIHVLKAATDN